VLAECVDFADWRAGCQKNLMKAAGIFEADIAIERKIEQGRSTS